VSISNHRTVGHRSAHLQDELDQTTRLLGATPTVSRGEREGERYHVVHSEMSSEDIQRNPAFLRGAIGIRPHGTIANGSKSYLIHDIEIVFEGGRTHSAEIIVQDIAKCLQECECNQRIGYNPEGSEMRRHGDIVGPTIARDTRN
jgi:hypothetical protein